MLFLPRRPFWPPFYRGGPVGAMFGSREPEIQKNISKESFDIFDLR
jgi:hypothetical protein